MMRMNANIQSVRRRPLAFALRSPLPYMEALPRAVEMMQQWGDR
jgi:hypothetical protein